MVLTLELAVDKQMFFKIYFFEFRVSIPKLIFLPKTLDLFIVRSLIFYYRPVRFDKSIKLYNVAKSRPRSDWNVDTVQ